MHGSLIGLCVLVSRTAQLLRLIPLHCVDLHRDQTIYVLKAAIPATDDTGNLAALLAVLRRHDRTAQRVRARTNVSISIIF